MTDTEHLSNKIDLVSKSMSLAFKVCVTIGVIIVAYYCISIDYFPRDLTVGDGALFVIVSLVFGFIYLFFTYCLICAGLLISKPITFVISVISFTINLFRNITGRAKAYPKISFHKLTGENYFFAFFGVFIAIFSSNNVESLLRILATIIICAYLYTFFLKNNSIKQKIHNKNSKTKRELSYLSSKGIQAVAISGILATPLLIGGISESIVKGTMRLTEVRNDNVYAHIAKPYTKVLNEYGIQGNKSSIGRDFKKYDNVNVLLSAFGSMDIVEFTNNDNKSVIAIPKDKIFIIKKAKQ